VITAAIAAAGLIYQIGRQFRHAIDQDRDNERQKLKLEVYKELVELCRRATEAEVALSTYVRVFESGATVARNLARQGQPPLIPQARIPRLFEIRKHLDDSFVELIFFTERWAIIEPRVIVFKTAFNVAAHSFRTKYEAYSQFVWPLTPVELPAGHPQQGTLFP